MATGADCSDVSNTTFDLASSLAGNLGSFSIPEVPGRLLAGFDKNSSGRVTLEIDER